MSRSKQMAAVFGNLYYMILFWDRFFSYTPVFGAHVTPPLDMYPAVLFTDKMERYWMEHTYTMLDYFKCVAGDKATKGNCEHEILSQLLDSYTSLGTWVGGFL